MKLTLSDKAPIKYHLDLHNEVSEDDKFSVLYDIEKYIIKVIKAKGRVLDMSELKFTAKSLKYIFGERIKDETFKQKTVKSIKELITLGYLRVENKTIYITEKGVDLFYKID